MPKEVCETPNAVNDIRDSFQSFLKVSGDDIELWKTSGKNWLKCNGENNKDEDTYLNNSQNKD